MNTVLVQSPLITSKIDKLLKEFPHYRFLSLSETACRSLSEDEWKKVEVFFGDRLIAEEFLLAENLRWIHTPGESLARICLIEIQKRANLILTCTEDENIFQVAEFVLAGVLAFTKALFQWKLTCQAPGHLWDSRFRDSMKTLKNSQFLQIGMGTIGGEICRRMHEFEMKVWGVGEKRSFNPYCHKLFAFHELHSLLPAADVVSLIFSKNQRLLEQPFGKKELALMKEGSILSFVGPCTLLDDEALAAALQKGAIKGAVLDFHYHTPLPKNSPLWGLENVLITPEVSPRPKKQEKSAFSTFLFNLRQYNHGNYRDMKNKIEL